jgi:acyl-CoA reductase-like NAD-dependent aldehyde dehydrogenase
MHLTFQFGECLKKLHRRYLAGVPCIVKPATDGAQLTQAVVKAIEEAHVLPKGRYNSFVVKL